MAFVTVARVEDVPPGNVPDVRAGEEEIALANSTAGSTRRRRTASTSRARSARASSRECVITCPWHGWQYDVRTGLNEFDLAIQLRTYDVQVEDGEIQVAI